MIIENAGEAIFIAQDGVSVLPIRIASQREKAEPGNVYIAQEEHFMGINPQGLLNLAPYGYPGDLTLSASRLFASTVESYGPGTIGILLTGMGTDEAKDASNRRWNEFKDGDKAGSKKGAL